MNTTRAASVAVVGPGAIGTAIAAALHEAGRTPLLCGRTPRPRLTLHDGDRLITVPGPVRVDPQKSVGPLTSCFWRSRRHRSRRLQTGSPC